VISRDVTLAAPVSTSPEFRSCSASDQAPGGAVMDDPAAVSLVQLTAVSGLSTGRPPRRHRAAARGPRSPLCCGSPIDARWLVATVRVGDSDSAVN